MPIYISRVASEGNSRILIFFLFFVMPLQVNCAETETAAVGYCIAQGVVEPTALAYCVGSAQTQEEIVESGNYDDFDVCTDSEGNVTIVNQTNEIIQFNMEGSCTDAATWSVNPQTYITIAGKGDKWYNISLSSPGGLVTYALYSGMTFALQWQENLLHMVNITPRFNP